MTLPLPDEQWTKLLALATPPGIGDVWLLPKEHVRFPGGKPRRCLVVALEPPDQPVRVHLIAGTSSWGPPPARIVVEPDYDNGLDNKTYFKFQDPVEELDVLNLQTVAKRIGYVAESVREKIAPAIKASDLTALKQLTRERP